MKLRIQTCRTLLLFTRSPEAEAREKKLPRAGARLFEDSCAAGKIAWLFPNHYEAPIVNPDSVILRKGVIFILN